MEAEGYGEYLKQVTPFTQPDKKLWKMNKDIRICFVGDSFVNGTGDETALGWAGRLSAAANKGGASITCYNLGIRRNTSRDILHRFEAECSARLHEVCDGRVVLSCGVNDTAIENGAERVPYDESRANVRLLLNLAGKYKRVFVGPPPVADTEHNERIMALSNAFMEEAGAQGVPYIDLFSPLVSDARYMLEVRGNDGSHPSARGYEKMTNIILASADWWFFANE